MDETTWRDHLRTATQLRAAAYARLGASWPGGTAIELVEPTVDDYSGVTVGVWGGYWVKILGMAFGNERLVLAERRHPTGLWEGDGSYDHGWCYPGGGAAMPAVLLWDPQEQAEPLWYVKRATPRPRVAGERARWLDRAGV